MEYLHTMIRVTDLKATIAFFELLGFVETRRLENEKGRYTLVFLAAPADAERARKDQSPLIELTYYGDFGRRPPVPGRCSKTGVDDKAAVGDGGAAPIAVEGAPVGCAGGGRSNRRTG